VLYSKNGPDEKGRAAAAIAANHFDDLGNLPNTYYHGIYITKAELGVDHDYVTGNFDSELRANNRHLVEATAVTATVAAVSAKIGLISVEVPPFSAFFDGLAGLSGMASLGFLGLRVIDKKMLASWSRHDQDAVNSWLHKKS